VKSFSACSTFSYAQLLSVLFHQHSERFDVNRRRLWTGGMVNSYRCSSTNVTYLTLVAADSFPLPALNK